MTARRILFVDDEAAMRSAIAECFVAAGHHVTEASDAASAEAAFLEERHDVIITDIRLPDGCGLDLLARLRTMDTQFAAIVTTGYGTYEQAIEAIRLKVSAFLSKPFPASELLKVVEELDTPTAAATSEPAFRASSESSERSINALTLQIETELARLQAQPWVSARALELLCEALENVVKHAYPGGSGMVDVTVARDGGGLLMKVADHGCGFDISNALAGVLAGREGSPDAGIPGLLRFHREADEVRLQSEPGAGTCVLLRFRHAFQEEPFEFTEPTDDEMAVACLWS